MFNNAIKSTLNGALPMLIIFIVVISTVRITGFKTSGKKMSIHDEIMNLLFIVYALLLFEILTGTENSLGSGVNLIPFKEISRYDIGSKMFIYNVVGNILIFIPFGYFISRYIKPKRVLPIIINSLITSITVEIVQLNIGRSFDIDDVLLNLVGAIIGYFLYVAVSAILHHLPKFLQKEFFYDALSIIILVGFVMYLLNICGLRWF